MSRRASPLIGRNGRLLPETLALVARMTTPPSAARVKSMNRLIERLVRGGIWSKLHAFWMLAGHNAADIKLNWVNSNFNLTGPFGSVTVTTDRGVTFTSSGYYDTNYYSQEPTNPLDWEGNNNHFGVYIRQLPASGGQRTAMGISYSSGGNYYFRSNSDTTQFNLRNGSQFSNWMLMTGIAAGTHMLISRGVSTDFMGYKNGVFDQNLTTGHDTGSDDTLFIGAERQVGSGAPINYFNGGEISYAHIGKALTATEVGELHAACKAYLTELGAA